MCALDHQPVPDAKSASIGVCRTCLRSNHLCTSLACTAQCGECCCSSNTRVNTRTVDSLLPTTVSSRMALYKIVVRDYLGRPPDPAGQHNFSRRCFDEPTPRPSKFTRHAKYKASRSLSFNPAKAHTPKTFVNTKEAPFWYSLESREERKKYDYDLITQKHLERFFLLYLQLLLKYVAV